MRDIFGYFANPFENRDISLSNLFSFTTDHLERMKANNPGGWLDGRIAATSAAWTIYHQSEGTEMGKLAMRKSRKRGKAIFRQGLRAKLGRLHGAMVGKYGERAPEVAECFGQGREKFARATDDGLGGLLKGLHTSMSAHVADLGAAVIADAQSLVTDWTAVYDASESATGAKTLAQEEKKSARAALQVELFRNLLALAAAFPGEPAKLSLYMQKSLFRIGRGKKKE